MRRILVALIVAAATLVAAGAPAEARDETGARCRIVIHQRTSGAHKWLVKGRLFRKGDAYTDRRVALQLRPLERWMTLAKEPTDEDGRVKLGPIRITSQVTLRFRYGGDDDTRNCVSRPFTLTPR